MIQEASNSFKEHEANVSFKVSPAECIPVEDKSTQLVLVGRALHYFDQKTFFKEVDRMLVNIYHSPLGLHGFHNNRLKME